MFITPKRKTIESSDRHLDHLARRLLYNEITFKSIKNEWSIQL